MKPETAWLVLGCIGGGLVGFDLLPSIASLIFLTAVFAWFAIAERRGRRSRTIDGTTEGQDQLAVPNRIEHVGTSMYILAGGILALAIGVLCHSKSVW